MGYNLKTDYDFSAVDSVMPDIVMSDICNELEKSRKVLLLQMFVNMMEK